MSKRVCLSENRIGTQKSGWALVLFIVVLYSSQIRAEIVIKSNDPNELVALDVKFITYVIVNHKLDYLQMSILTLPY